MRSQRTQKEQKAQKNAMQEEVLILRNQLVRTLADYDNLRKRVGIEREGWIKFSTERFIAKIVPVLDALESAQVHLKDSGLAIVISEFRKVLDEEGIAEIKPQSGDQFSHDEHEAVESLKGGERDHIAELVLTGWRYKEGKVIRHAKVKVYLG
ncbi:nucleotide exchange factor GrpE [Candidatus Woesebacteria bacterium RIFCSPLOWO2_01_FULL_39_23]|uniref:Protein GrpE n=2 Tax=Microgenomates group TaxID=1794810 RepID=A0A0H4T3P7_9BACT|nr:GrpE protein HSP-70 cofactor, molecular chaperone GrpE [uncultured Microgenomates bacterium Rifle_16ft_4_minimus_37633]OGM13834.1 MAG: nucleotide exchange factor GrpE [Candidatus Woesebacteria bacterium RBG_16_40_11]OGM27784.1 MAG: nucleotide exchange factor GrpE [Candidatus Woesebacteria bacterium RIFCSPHIGHO2_01_FULL_40_22]OGM36203.1 MAG: nucleotide exchange factor GrpE [Candidatus Woesebacteria bacterium RIFCSPHIGHO2_12_FULL_38_9]OGM62206.1 MAG: nucleotide exchange factor GrpE [Candidatus